MRLVGLILVVLGALALGIRGFGLGPVAAADEVSPVGGGIALVVGLILIATNTRRAWP